MSKAASWLVICRADQVPYQDAVRGQRAGRSARLDGGRLWRTTTGGIHHVEIWFADFEGAIQSLGWLLGELGYSVYQDWTDGRSYRLGDTYIVLERSADLSTAEHDRQRPGSTIWRSTQATAGASTSWRPRLALDHGWSLLLADRHPHAGGQHHYAAYLDNAEGFEIELCASSSLDSSG